MVVTQLVYEGTGAVGTCFGFSPSLLPHHVQQHQHQHDVTLPHDNQIWGTLCSAPLRNTIHGLEMMEHAPRSDGFVDGGIEML
jgi:hypothetical protein